MPTAKHRDSIAVIYRRRAIMGTLLAAMIQTAYGEAVNGKAHFDIPAQPLNKALLTFGKQSQQQLIYSTDIAENQHSHALQGDYEIPEALDILLSDTPLQAVATEGGTLSVQRKAAGLYNSSDALPAVTVSATAARSNAFAEPEDRTHYNLPNASSAMKTDTPILETAQSIQVVPRALMDDQQVISLEDAMKNVVGLEQNIGNTFSNPTLRGFGGDSFLFRNGLRQGSQADVETAQLSRVEVVKGPMSGLYGRIQAGGLIDMITNRPEEEARYSLQQQFGSFSTYRTVLDATGPLLADKSLLYRLNFVYKANNSFRDYVNADHIFVMPSVTWQPNDDFDANINMEYQHDNYVYDSGVMALNTSPLKVPISTFYGDGVASQANPYTLDRVLFAYDWNYHFNADWKLTNRFSFNKFDYTLNTIYPYTAAANGRTYTTRLLSYFLPSYSYTTNLDLTGHFDTGFVNHSTLLGYDYYRYQQTNDPGLNVNPLPSSIMPPNSVYSPYNNLPFNLPSYQATTLPNFSSQQISSWNGLYLQDQMKLWDQLQIMIGGRFDWATSGSANGGGKPLDSFSIPTSGLNAFRPRFGLLYQPVEWGSVYANYIESIGPSNGISAQGQAFAPQTGVQYEVGAKTEFFDKRLLTTLALYSITRSNTLTPDPRNPLYSIAIGQARSNGLEFTVQGEVTKNISLYGGYTYDAAKITQDNSGNQGKMLPNVPLNAGNLWAKYAFDNDVLPGLNLGTGVFVVGNRQGDVGNTFQLPGYAHWDANASYTFEEFGGKITTQLNVYNILNQTYYTNATGSNLWVTPGAPLSFLGSVRVEF